MSIEKFSADSFPSSWHVQPLSQFSDHRPGTINPMRYAEETFEYYSIPAYQDGKSPALARGSEIGSSKILLESGTVLFGKLNPRVEKVWRVGKYTPNRKIGSTEWLPLVPRDDVDEDFLYFLMWSEHVMPKAKTMVSGSTPSRQRVDPRSFYRIEAPLPPLAEQRKIASVLGLVQGAIEQQERLIALTTELKKSLMHKLFTEGLRGERQKQTEIGPVPESWQATTLGRLACGPHGFLQTGPFGSQLHKHDYTDQGVGVVNPTHLWGNRINHEDIPRVSYETASRLDRHRLVVGDILFARRGEIGRHGMVTEDEEGWLCGTGCFLVRVLHEHTDNRFLSYLFSTPGAIAWLNSHAAGAIMPNLNNTVLQSMPVYYPKRDAQEEIADCLDAIEQKVLVHERKKLSFSDLFRTLLHQLMTAQIRVHDLDLSFLEEDTPSYSQGDT